MARDFTGGSSDRVDVGTFAVVTDLFTMGCWFLIDSFSAPRDDRFISKADGTGVGNHDWMLGCRGAGNIRARANRMGDSVLTVVGATTVTTGVWHHALMTYDGTLASSTQGQITVYLDGVQDGQGTSNVGEGGNLPNNTDAVYIGNQPTSTANAPDGRIAEVGIWNVKLTANEIAMLAKGIPPSRVRPVSLEGYWRLGVGSTEPDWSGKARNGTLTGTAIAGHSPTQSPYGFGEGWQGAFTASAPAGGLVIPVAMAQYRQRWI